MSPSEPPRGTAPPSPRGGAAPAPSTDDSGVSVVIPVLDDAETLAGCLAALTSQTRPPLEIIVVDNSPPGPADPAISAVARSVGARVVREVRPGVAAASAAGYDAAHGTILARLDADSRPAPDWVATVVAEIEGRNLHAVTGPGCFYDIPGLRGRIASAAYHSSLQLGVGAAMGNVPLWGSTMAVRRGVWLHVRHRTHSTDPAVHDDLDLAFALGPLARIGWSRGMAVGVEGRTFGSARALASRVRRTLYTCRLHWDRQSAGERLLCGLTRGRLFRKPEIALLS